MLKHPTKNTKDLWAESWPAKDLHPVIHTFVSRLKRRDNDYSDFADFSFDCSIGIPDFGSSCALAFILSSGL
jgi:hypothetical protein